ncbi:hypothetical protein LY76DRAFT_649392 [Colletotrichum caudatum]|nr:hypothetical protein LY76DRAFT_649392 [Colletotrichum caudatum]
MPGHTLMWCFEKSMQGIRETLEELEKEATKLQSKKNSLMGKWDKTKFLWKEDFSKTLCRASRTRGDMVAIVMSGIQLNDLQRLIAMPEAGQTPVLMLAPPIDQLQPPPRAIKKSKSDTQIKKSGTRLAEDL